MRNALNLLALAAATLVLSAATQAAGLPEKAADAIRIGIVQPRVHLAGKDAAKDATKQAEAVRSILIDYLQGPTIEVVQLSARLPSQYAIEAQKADCNFILTTTLTHRRGSKGGGGDFLNKLSGVTPYVPNSAKVEMATAVLNTAQDFASTVKARDDMQLDLKLDALGNPDAVLNKTLKKKAKSDGEDLLTPLVEGAAEAVGATVAGH
jgi:hypothetical protein